MSEAPRIAVVTGANQGIGRAIVTGLQARMSRHDVVYLTGRNSERVAAAAAELDPGRRTIVPYRLDVRSDEDVASFGAMIGDRHGGVDLVFSNAGYRRSPDMDRRAQVRPFVDTNDLGATRMIRSLGPLLRPGGRFLITASDFGTLRGLAPRLHACFDTDHMGLDELDATMLRYVDLVESGRDAEEGWPESVNVPSKIGQVAAARIFARLRAADAQRDGMLIAAVCPGLVDTPTSRPWFTDMSGAQTPDQAAARLLPLALEPIRREHYGQLVQFGRVVPWR
jgi:NAD(P)-dependent dehydrogenase (short-subunit alcohol dehydrogenase family)